jgi:hypothetical protein
MIAGVHPRLYLGSKVFSWSCKYYIICKGVAGDQMFIDQQKQKPFVTYKNAFEMRPFLPQIGFDPILK